MAFNHYAKMKRVLAQHHDWYIVRIDQPTTASKFNGEKVTYSHYYRVYDSLGEPIAFCKFQQLERFAETMKIPVEELPIVSTN